jgi:cellulose synthase/poly-beta-1,6-N-acetylglucosamine synthase-like glycosyltransferase
MVAAMAFWGLLFFVAYTYALYPLLLLLAVRLRERPLRQRGGGLPSVSFVVAARNEEAGIVRRIEELVRQLEEAGVAGEVIVVSDGSTDQTVARALASGQVQVLELPRNMGKAVALTQGCALARHEILVFADVRQRWAPDALRRLLENFADPDVGAATGDLVLEARPGLQAGVGLYWRYEKLVRRLESRLHSTVGVTGAIAAVRRPLFTPIPPGTLLDDVYWPLQVARQGFRVVHDRRAVAYDQLPARPRDEFRRKLRTLTGNFQLMARLPGALLPRRNPIWWQYLSHKLCRLAAPWALLALLGLSLHLTEAFYGMMLWAQVAFYSVALMGLTRVGTVVRAAGAAGSFVLLNAAAWLAFWHWLLGSSTALWGTCAYAPEPGAAAGPQSAHAPAAPAHVLPPVS